MKLTPSAHPHPQPAHADWEVLLHPVEGSQTPRGTDRNEDETAGFDEIEADRRSERRLIEQTLLALLAVAALIGLGLQVM